MPIPIVPIIVGVGICICYNVTPPILRKANRTIKKIRSHISTKLYHKQFIKKTYNTKSEKDDCIICMDDYLENNKCSELYCGHKYHNKCIAQWMNERKTCPLCNTGFILKSGEIYKTECGEDTEEINYNSF